MNLSKKDGYLIIVAVIICIIIAVYHHLLPLETLMVLKNLQKMPD